VHLGIAGLDCDVACGRDLGFEVDAKTKKPHHFQPAAKPFAFAGVWDVWSGDGKVPITSFSIVTTSAAPSTAQYHDRMPVVLEESQFEDWMRGPPNLAAEIMKPTEARSTSGKWARMSGTFATPSPTTRWQH
jgi:putative SOS response-associated peptidase YedK